MCLSWLEVCWVSHIRLGKSLISIWKIFTASELINFFSSPRGGSESTSLRHSFSVRIKWAWKSFVLWMLWRYWFFHFTARVGVCGENSSGLVWRRAGSAVWEGRAHMGPEVNDGPSVRTEPRLCVHHLLQQRRSTGGCQTGECAEHHTDALPHCTQKWDNLTVVTWIEFAWLYTINTYLCSLSLTQCDNYEIRPGKYLGVCISVANNRLFVGSIPKNKTRESILEDFGKVTGQNPPNMQLFVKQLIYIGYILKPK